MPYISFVYPVPRLEVPRRGTKTRVTGQGYPDWWYPWYPDPRLGAPRAKTWEPGDTQNGVTQTSRTNSVLGFKTILSLYIIIL